MLLAVKFTDKYLERNRPLFINPVLGVGPEDPRRPGIPVVAFTYYPFTGGHTQANFSVYDGKFRSGDHGFNIDFDLDNPPPKQKGERRIILTGGSAAWGWGASSNDKTMGPVIERALSACKVRVINLAMSGSSVYANYIALNEWGHALEPDAIISFSGANDMWVPPYPYVHGMNLLNGFVAATFPANTPPHLAKLFARFPGIFEHTGLGLAIRTTFIADYEEAAAKDYRQRFLSDDEIVTARFKGVVPQYVHAHKSIKRDFSGIPILVAYQPYMARPGNRGQAGMTDAQIAEYLPRYEAFIKETSQQLRGNMNDEWLFFNAHAFYQERMLKDFDPKDGVHMSDEKQQIFGAELARLAARWVCK